MIDSIWHHPFTMTDNRDNQIKNRAGLSPAALGGPVKTDFLFTFPLLNQRLQLLQRLISDGEFLTLVVGEPASGKSMLLRYLLLHNRGRSQACRIRLYPTKDPNHPSPSKHLQNLSAFMLNNEHQFGLILDDAHLLSLKALQLLIRSIQESENHLIRFSIVLLGEPRLKQMIDRVSDILPAETAVTTLYMPTLNEEQTKVYLRRRVRVHRPLEQFEFSDKQIKNIYQASGGLPGRINQEANKMLVGLQSIGKKQPKLWRFLKKRLYN